jgi:hypothetical protein
MGFLAKTSRIQKLWEVTMPKYVLVVKQYEGDNKRDYTFFEAVDFEQAKNWSMCFLMSKFGPYENCDHDNYPCFFSEKGENNLKEAILVEISQHVEVGASYKNWFSDQEEEHRKQIKDATDAKERELYERLKKKYE